MQFRIPSIKKERARNLAIAGLVAAAAIGLFALTSKSDKSLDISGSQGGNAVAIQITSEGFIPATVKVLPGSQVTWTNSDNKAHKVASNPHPIHSEVKGLESPDLDPGASYTYKFDQKGSFGYHDHLNLTRLGTVIVE